MSRVAVVTDSASDLEPDEATAASISVVPLFVTFGEREYRSGIDLSSEGFWRELTAPGAPFPRTAAAPPGSFKDMFESLFADGADEIVYVGVGSKLSATVGSARVARDMLADSDKARIHVVDSTTASVGIAHLAKLAVRLAAEGKTGGEIASELERRRSDVMLYVALDTLEYLKRGGRLSPARAAIGSMLSVKPIISIEDGVVDTADRPRTRGKARVRLLELLTQKPAEEVAVMHGQAPDVEQFADDLATALRFPRERMTISLIGPSVGPHVGPGAYGAVILTRP
jgi:DegV family protein with EDD domain